MISCQESASLVEEYTFIVLRCRMVEKLFSRPFVLFKYMTTQQSVISEGSL